MRLVKKRSQCRFDGDRAQTQQFSRLLTAAPDAAEYPRLAHALSPQPLTDALRLHHPEPKLYSWWDYREMAFRRNRGLRIDHILVSDALKPRVQACDIDKAPRKNERPSDHTPVVVTL